VDIVIQDGQIVNETVTGTAAMDDAVQGASILDIYSVPVTVSLTI